MIKLCKRDILIQKESIPTAKAIKKFERYGMKDKVHLLKYRRSSAVNIYRIEGFEDYFYGYMAYSTGILKYFDLIKYDEVLHYSCLQKKNRKLCQSLYLEIRFTM